MLTRSRQRSSCGSSSRRCEKNLVELAKFVSVWDEWRLLSQLFAREWRLKEIGQFQSIQCDYHQEHCTDIGLCMISDVLEKTLKYDGLSMRGKRWSNAYS